MDFALDHLVYFVRDVGRSADTLRAVGFHVVAGGRHPRWGTANALAYFGLTYVEILGVDDPEAAAKATVGTAAQALLDIPHGDGLGRFVLRTRSLDAVARRWREAGAEAEAVSGERIRPDGSVLRWRLLFPPWAQDRSFPMPFVIEWEEPDDVRERDLRRLGALAPHPNGVERLLGVAAAVADLDAVVSRFAALYGVRPSDPVALPGLPGRPVIPFRLQNATVFFHEGPATPRGERPDLVFLAGPPSQPRTHALRRGPFHLVLVARDDLSVFA